MFRSYHFFGAIRTSKKLVFIVIALLMCVFGTRIVSAQESVSVLYVPLIGISSVPDPLALTNGPGNVTYKYAVKNFLREFPLSNIQVADDKCLHVTFVEGDDNNDTFLDYNETWRYICTTRLTQTTQSIATATGQSNSIHATHKAYATVVVGAKDPPPLISIVNITKVAYPLSLPSGGGDITFTYRVNNPGVTPLRFITVVDDKCRNMSGKLGDTNGNNLLDTDEVWIYTCTTHLVATTTNTVHVTAYANGFQAVGEATITVHVDTPAISALVSAPKFPNVGTTEANPALKIIVWSVLSTVLVILGITFLVITQNSTWKRHKATINPSESDKKS